MSAAPSTTGGSQNGPAVDLDLQAVEGIPKDTLVALLKRKDKEAKGLAAKLDKLEERYVKVVRFNKILMEDRTSFQRFCNELLPESDGIFEEAAAQESPVNLDALLRRLTAWRSAFDGASEDRRVFHQFMQLVFPGDEAVAQLFEAPALSSEAFDTLQHRWVALEDLNNQCIASINAMSRAQVVEKSREVDAAVVAKQEADRRMEEMREQLTQVAREKAQMLKQRFQGGGHPDTTESSLLSASTADGKSVDTKMTAHLAAGTFSGPSADQLSELRDAREAAERRELEARAVAERREQELQAELEAQQTEVRRMKKEADTLREEGERHRTQVRQLVEQKDAVVNRLQQRIVELEQELNSNSFIVQCAEQQAGRDAEVKAKDRQLQQVENGLAEAHRLLTMSYDQERVLKARIRELESSQGRVHVAGDYLKHVSLKYIQYNQVGDLKAHSLVPVLCTLLNLSPEERKSVEETSIPQPLLLINQAVGGASTWLRGGSSSTDDMHPA